MLVFIKCTVFEVQRLSCERVIFYSSSEHVIRVQRAKSLLVKQTAEEQKRKIRRAKGGSPPFSRIRKKIAQNKHV